MEIFRPSNTLVPSPTSPTDKLWTSRMDEPSLLNSLESNRSKMKNCTFARFQSIEQQFDLFKAELDQ